MELNQLLFPAPSVKYSPEELEGDIMYIPRFYRYKKEHQIAMKNMKFVHENINRVRRPRDSGSLKEELRFQNLAYSRMPE
jgi:hypothetical protein